jgi:hypothetical protein
MGHRLRPVAKHAGSAGGFKAFDVESQPRLYGFLIYRG